MTHYERGPGRFAASLPTPCPTHMSTHNPLSHSPFSLTYSHPVNPYRKTSTPPYQLEPITGLPC